MTPADQTLCRDIAEAEGWIHVHRKGFGMQTYECWGVPPASDTRRPGGKDGSLYEIPGYLDDPAETVRMLKALFEDHWSIDKIISRVYGDEGDCEPTDSFEHAVAEAFLAMLLAQQEEKV